MEGKGGRENSNSKNQISKFKKEVER